MISLKELNPHDYPTTPEIQANLETLLYSVNRMRAAYGKPMVVTSGLRSDADQQRINPKAIKSNHKIGAACDFKDTDGALATWIQANMKLMEDIGLWFESFSSTPGWVHMQIVKPLSGKRIFLP